MELITLVDELWKYPSVELLFVHEVTGENLYKVNTFINLLKILNIDVSREELFIHPVTVFASILSNQGIFKHDDKPTGEGGTPKELVIKKISLNKYQKISLRYGEIIKELKLPNSITPTTIREMKYKDVSIMRPPQLRRTIIDYFRLLKIEINVVDLEYKLIETDIDNPIYSYLDADEIFFKECKYYKDTQFELLPQELVDIIKYYMDNCEYISKNDLTRDHSPQTSVMLQKIISPILNNINQGQDMSLMDIITDFDFGGLINTIKEKQEGPKNIVNIINDITEEYGIGNMINNIGKQINK